MDAQKIGKVGVAVRRYTVDGWREEGVGSEVGSHCNLTGSGFSKRSLEGDIADTLLPT